jgi:hypothetical protein
MALGDQGRGHAPLARGNVFDPSGDRDATTARSDSFDRLRHVEAVSRSGLSRAYAMPDEADHDGIRLSAARRVEPVRHAERLGLDLGERIASDARDLEKSRRPF